MFDHEVEELLTANPAGLDDDSLNERLEQLIAVGERIEAARLRTVGEWDARAMWAYDGAGNGGAWLAAKGQMGRSAAGGLVRAARRLRTMPHTAAALADGTLGPAKARLFTGVINARTEQAFAECEEMLVAEAAPLTVDQTATMLRYWEIQADADGANDDANGAHDANVLHLSQTWRGRWRLDANFDPDCGAVLAGVLGAIADELHHAARDNGEATPPAPKLRADALIEMARRAAGAKRFTSRPLVWVVADLQTLQSGVGACEIVGAGPITAETARRLACDAGVARVLTDGPSAVVDLGVTSRTATASQRRLLALRHGGGCVFPGCDRPPDWCDAHHIHHWINGGPTDLDNLILVCSHHHHRLHEGGFSVRRHLDGTLVFARPDGTLLPEPMAAA